MMFKNSLNAFWCEPFTVKNWRLEGFFYLGPTLDASIGCQYWMLLTKNSHGWTLNSLPISKTLKLSSCYVMQRALFCGKKLLRMAFILSLNVIWVRWGWILRWVFQVALIGLLGPWMMIVDKKYFAKTTDISDEAKKERIRERE
jgi:hypothetical protein